MAEILTGDVIIARYRALLYHLLMMIMDHDLAHVVDGPERLDRVAWEIARYCAEDDPYFPAHLQIYLKEEK